MIAIARSLRITSKKINLIADLVRMKNVAEALNILNFTPKKGARLLKKIVRSAVANAENNFKQERPTLFIKEIVVTEGPTMKRSVPVSRGRSNPILKRTAHISVMLGVVNEEGKMEVKKTAKRTKSASASTEEKTDKKIKVASKVKKTMPKATPVKDKKNDKENS
jgi:large subunit ribosomal protein L22